MKDLNRLTADGLIRLHNARADAFARIDGPWKRSKRDLIDRIHALGAPEPVDHRAGITESAKADEAETVGAMVEALVTTDLAYVEIVRLVRERFPEARTTARSVSNVACELRRRGVAVSLRRQANAVIRPAALIYR